MTKIITKIAGVFKYPDAKAPMKAMQEGAPYQFEREPTNPFDANAIGLYARIEDQAPVRCGYIPAKVAAQLVGIEIESVVKGASWDEIIINVKE